MKLFKYFAMFLILANTMACGKMIMPYKSEYGCPNKDKGMCAPVESVYEHVRNEDKAILTNSIKSIDGIYESAAKDSEAFQDLLDRYEDAVRDNNKDEMARLMVVINEKYRGSVKVGEYRKKIEMDMSRAASQHQIVQRLVETKSKFGPQRTEAVKMQVTIIPYETESGYFADARHLWVVVEDPSWLVDKTKINLKESSTLGKIED